MSSRNFFEGKLPALKARRHLPAVCLDIDGVLNPEVEETPEGLKALEGFLPYQVNIPSSDLPEYSPFLRGNGREDLKGRVWVNPMYGTWITKLTKRADVYWSTTWENAANIHYAPLLGIKPLEVIPHSEWPFRFSDIKNGDVGHWKHYALSDLFSKRALVWVDDKASKDTTYWRGKVPTLVIVPDERIGLTKEQMDQIDKFVDAQIQV